MYATLEESGSIEAARRLGAARRGSGSGTASLPVLTDQVCAEAGLWAPEAARRALTQSGGDLAGAVALVRVWAAALPHVEAVPLRADDVHLVRRVSAAFPEIPGGQWLGAAPDLGTRLLTWDDEPTSGTQRDVEEGRVRTDGPDAGAPAAVHAGADDAAGTPCRGTTPRVREQVRDVPLVPVTPVEDGADPARTALVPPFGRTTRLGVLARAETSAAVTLASLVLARSREAVLLEATTAEADVRVPHPRTGEPCRVATVPVTEVEAVVDAEVDGRAGFAVGWGATLGTHERRAIALALLDGALQARDSGTPGAELDEATVLAATDGAATHGFVEHLLLPHYASFASYLDQARRAATPEGTP